MDSQIIILICFFFLIAIGLIRCKYTNSFFDIFFVGYMSFTTLFLIMDLIESFTEINFHRTLDSSLVNLSCIPLIIIMTYRITREIK